MTEENISQIFGLKNTDEAREKVCTIFNYIELLLILVSTFTECIFHCAFASLVGIPAVITSSAIGLRICEIRKHYKMYC